MVDNCDDYTYHKSMVKNPFDISLMRRSFSFSLFFLIFTVCLFCFISCSLDYQEGKIEEEITGKTPNAIIYNLRRVNIDSSGEKIVVTAKTSTFFRETEETVFEGVEFYQEDKNQRLLRNGTIGSGILKKSDDAELSDGIYLFDKENDSVIEAENLSWTDSTRILATEGFVTVSQPDGTKLEGEGLLIDFSINTITMESQVEGIIITEEE